MAISTESGSVFGIVQGPPKYDLIPALFEGTVAGRCVGFTSKDGKRDIVFQVSVYSVTRIRNDAQKFRIDGYASLFGGPEEQKDLIRDRKVMIKYDIKDKSGTIRLL